MSESDTAWMDKYTWTDALNLTVGGLGWRKEHREQPFDRLPASMKDLLPETTWWLGKQSAGVYVEFRTCATSIAVRWECEQTGGHPQDPYMPLSGQGGVDLYGRDGQGIWRWAGCQQPFAEPQANGKLTKLPLDGVDRIYRVYFPLMRRILKLEVGTNQPATPSGKDSRLPIVYYGTSIVHGAGVSRPGTGHAQMLSRELDMEVYNLGFCGNAKCETSVADLLARQPARMILLDPVPNNGVEELAGRLRPFLQTLLPRVSDIPVLCVEERLFGDAAFQPERGENCTAKNHVLQSVMQEFRKQGFQNLHLVKMGDYYGEDGSTDSNHPNDLGSRRLYERLLPAIQAHL